MKNGTPEKLLMSFHGLPQFTLDKGDPYHCECQKTGRLLAQELGLKPEQYADQFPVPLRQGGMAQALHHSHAEGMGSQQTTRVDVVCPGFVADCLETLEEIAMEGKEDFQHAGGGEYHYIPCLNDRNDWIHALTDLVMDNLQGWLDEPKAAELEQSRRLAQAAGARL